MSTTFIGKIYINDVQHSAEVQKALFELGFEWGAGGKNVSHTDAGCLFVEDGNEWCNRKVITFSDRRWAEKKREVPEFKIKTTYEMEFTPRSTIEINGVKYFEDEVVALAAHLTPVEA